MKLLTVSQIQRLDKTAIEQYGIPSLCLMENAGWGVAREVLRDFKSSKSARVSIVCGLGNNAGDGFVAARHLMNAKVKPDIFLIGDTKVLKEDAKINYQILRRCGYPMRVIQGIDKFFQKIIARSDTIVDAIFGVGLNREILDPFKSIIDFLNFSQKRIISIDIPSGLDGTTGEIYGVCVKAQKTVTFSYAKKGFFKKEGPKYVGEIVVVDIGIPQNLKGTSV